MSTAAGLGLVLLLIGLNGYFVAAEFAFVAARRTHLADAASRGDRRAGRALAVLRRLSFMLSGAQLGITATSLLVGFVAEPTLGRALRPALALVGVPEAASVGVSLTLALILATGVQMVFGELAPKNLAIAKPEPFARALAPSTLWYLRLAGPVIHFFDGASNGLLRLLRIDPVEELESGVDHDELEHIVEASGQQGSLSPDQTALLARAIDFRDLRAADAMVPRTAIVTLDVGSSCEELRALAHVSGHSRFPVVGDGLDDVRGVVHAKDVLGVAHADRRSTPVAALMGEPLAVPESAPLRALLSDLRDAGTALALVVDEHGGTAGIVTLEDVVEELVGEIRDEHDHVEPEVVALAGGRFLVPGSWRLDETVRDTGVHLPEGDYETLSGLVMAELERLPRVGDEVALPTARLRVLALDGHAVGRLVLAPRPGDPREEAR